MLSPFELGLGYFVVSLIKTGVYKYISTFRAHKKPPPSLKNGVFECSAHENDSLKHGFYSRRNAFFHSLTASSPRTLSARRSQTKHRQNHEHPLGAASAPGTPTSADACPRTFPAPSPCRDWPETSPATARSTPPRPPPHRPHKRSHPPAISATPLIAAKRPGEGNPGGMIRS
jgi:hypothetical protein